MMLYFVHEIVNFHYILYNIISNTYILNYYRWCFIFLQIEGKQRKEMTHIKTLIAIILLKFLSTKLPK